MVVVWVVPPPAVARPSTVTRPPPPPTSGGGSPPGSSAAGTFVYRCRDPLIACEIVIGLVVTASRAARHQLASRTYPTRQPAAMDQRRSTAPAHQHARSDATAISHPTT